MLSARITEEEADKFCAEHGVKKENFCLIAEGEHDPNKGELVIRMPCRHLAGRPASYVRCRAYQGYRPAVCGSYLCRVAVQYKTGFLEKEEALNQIRRAYKTGNVSYFNWTQAESETQLLKASLIPELLEAARVAYIASPSPTISLEDAENIFIAEAFTPVFDFRSASSHLKLNMIFDIFDRGELELEDLLTKAQLERVGLDERDSAQYVAMTIVAKFRSMFKKGL